MRTTHIFRVTVILGFSLLLVGSLAAQSGRGKARAKGAVTDQEGNPVKSAKVVLEFLGRDQVSFETTTNKKGEWGVLGLGTGMWRITVSAEGFAPGVMEQMIQQLERNPKIEMALVKIQESDQPLVEDEASLEMLDKGNELYDEQKYEEALKAYHEFLELNPAAFQVGLNIAECYREMEDYAAAVSEYQKVLENTNQDEPVGRETAAKALAGIGECYLKQGDFEQAQDYFKKSVDSFSENELIAYNVGEIYFSSAKLEEALQYFTLASEINPKWSDSFYKIGLVYLNLADFENAKENLNKFLALEPDTERAASVKNILAQIK